MAQADPTPEPDDDRPGESGTLSALADRAARTWTNALLRAGNWADRVDAVVPRAELADDHADDDLDEEIDPASGLEADDLLAVGDVAESESVGSDDAENATVRSGRAASVWAVTKAAVGLLGAPVAVPTMTVAALRTARITTARIEAFPEHLHALAEGRTPPLPGHRTVRRPSGHRYLITSDLHRCIPGRLDWPERQRVEAPLSEVLRATPSRRLAPDRERRRRGLLDGRRLDVGHRLRRAPT